MDLHDEQKENIGKERYYESLIGKDYAKGLDFILRVVDTHVIL